MVGVVPEQLPDAVMFEQPLQLNPNEWNQFWVYFARYQREIRQIEQRYSQQEDKTFESYHQALRDIQEAWVIHVVNRMSPITLQ